ncbi:MAG TPA: isoaspartyl peptidase/L-asparaginase [Chryseosolibacter sp.]|nr:isoaspartyl peptidase/L-asparaginase [Chryseosolibacter sp.]
MAACDSKTTSENQAKQQSGDVTLVIHGGAGTIRKENMSPEKEAAYHAAMKQALNVGYAILDEGGTSVDAVIAAIKVMEDSPLFNAGRGAVFTNEGKNELDASIMDGRTLMAGAVAGVTNVKNPITAAHAVMTKSQHVMLTGRGAEQFAEEQGLEIVDPSYFFDSTRYKHLLRLQEKEKNSGGLSVVQLSEDPFVKGSKFGTVGAVALDKSGNIAAGTSTGGMTNKRYGRVGDAPIIGAGTYANNATCGISATGWGEYFIRLSVAHDIAAMMEYAHLSIDEAADSVIMKKLTTLGGDGGVVGLDQQGNITMKFNSDGMYRGYIKERGAAKTFIYKDDP